MPRIENKALAYLVAFVVCVAALVPWWLFQSPYPEHYYLTLWPAVLFSAWYCGVGPAIFTVATSTLSVWYVILLPRYSFRLQNPSSMIGLAAFVLFSALVIGLVETNRRSQLLQWHQAELLDVANDAIIELSAENDTILYWNRGAEKLYGWSKAEALGRNVHALLHTVLAVSLDDCKAALLRDGQWEGEAVHTRRDGTQINVMIRGSLRRERAPRRQTWLQICQDITERKRAEREVEARLVAEAQLRASQKAEAARMRSEEALRQLSVRLLRVQDEERRRIARELHDSAGQYLAMVKMSIDAARHDKASAERHLDIASDLAQKCVTEIRTISHLLHPPLLDELGLASAISWYVEGFAARSGIKVDLDLPDNLARLGDDVELVLFRVIQESLTNIHRHSGSKTAEVHVGMDAERVSLVIRDHGKGNLEISSANFRPGIGIAGMRERIKDLAGVLEITSDSTGTCVRAELPIAARPSGDEEVRHPAHAG